MISIDDLPVFENVDYHSTVIDSGTEARIFMINQKRRLVAKVYHNLFWINEEDKQLKGDELLSPETIAYAQRELSIAEKLYTAGVSVPKPEGVFALSFPRLGIQRIPAFVMQYVVGRDWCYFSGEQRKRAERAFGDEMVKARTAGFTPADDTLSDWNVLYTVNDDTIKAVLFDFGGWKERKRGLSLL